MKRSLIHLAVLAATGRATRQYSAPLFGRAEYRGHLLVDYRFPLAA